MSGVVHYVSTQTQNETMEVGVVQVRGGVLDRIKKTNNYESDEQLASLLGSTVSDVKAMRDGAEISPLMALEIAVAQGVQFGMSELVKL